MDKMKSDLISGAREPHVREKQRPAYRRERGTEVCEAS